MRVYDGVFKAMVHTLTDGCNRTCYEFPCDVIGKCSRGRELIGCTLSSNTKNARRCWKELAKSMQEDE